MRPLGRHLLLRHGLAVTLLERAVVAEPAPAVARSPTTRHVKMFKSPDAPAGSDRLPVQRARVRLLVSAPESREKRDCPMHTQLHQIVTDMADRRGDAPALTFKDETVTYAELARARDAVRRRAAGARAAPAATGWRSTSTSGSRRSWRSSGPRAAGGVFVPVNPVLQGRPGRPTSCGDCGVRVLVTTAGASDAAARGARRQRRRARGRGRRAARRRRAPSRIARVRGVRRAASRPCVEPDGDRRRHGRDPLHVGQHRQAQGRGAVAPQPARRRRERQPVPRQHAPTT